LNNSNSSERRKIKRTINKKGGDSNSINELVEHVNSNGGIEYATKKMHHYLNKSLEILERFENNEARQALMDLAKFTIERNK
jgi:octaprenyl-diphosphate synthase